jgi:2-hydroxy-3-keto-5-methylthiopentenyl-1-phosphate phosphatase
MMKKPMIFCDFDGTITNSDNIIAIMKRFAPPEWERVKDDILDGRLSVQKGVSYMFSLLPSSLKEEIVAFLLENATIREGFADFVAYVKKTDIPFYVVSGGIDFFVHPLLEKWIEKEHIFCNSARFDRETIEIIWPYSCDEHCRNQCGCCKPSLIRKLANEEHSIIVIGDSITDLQAAKLADHVIARDFLLQKCRELNLSHTPFTTFFDVIDFFEEMKVKR